MERFEMLLQTNWKTDSLTPESLSTDEGAGEHLFPSDMSGDRKEKKEKKSDKKKKDKKKKDKKMKSETDLYGSYGLYMIIQTILSLPV